MNIQEIIKRLRRFERLVILLKRYTKLIRPERGTGEARSMIDRLSAWSPWIASGPSAWFVGAAAWKHLLNSNPWLIPVAVLIGAVIETQGVTTIYTLEKIKEWNIRKPKSEPEADEELAARMVYVYLAVTLGLVVALEVFPVLASLAPGMFPFLAYTGSVTLTQQAQIAEYKRALEEQREARAIKRQERKQQAQQAVSQSQQVAQPVATKGERIKTFILANPSMTNNAEVGRKVEATGEYVRRIRAGLNGSVKVKA